MQKKKKKKKHRTVDFSGKIWLYSHFQIPSERGAGGGGAGKWGISLGDYKRERGGSDSQLYIIEGLIFV